MRKLLIIGAALGALSVAACGKPAETKTEEAPAAPEAAAPAAPEAAAPATGEAAAPAAGETAAPAAGDAAAAPAAAPAEEKKADH